MKISILKTVSFCLLLPIGLYAQTEQEYAAVYQKIAPKLQAFASAKNADKAQFDTVGELLQWLKEENIKVNHYTYHSEMWGTRRYNRINLSLVDLKFYKKEFIDKGYHYPLVSIIFSEYLPPDQIENITRANKSKLTPEVIAFLKDREIAKIEIYGINGLKSSDNTAR